MSQRRNPFDGVTDYFSEISRMRSYGMHGRYEPGFERGAGNAERTHASAWVPVTDILAAGPDLVIRVELAGVDPNDVELRFAHGVLTISGTRRPGTGDEDATFLIRERLYGEFRRVITLPEDTAPEQIRAEFDDGLVEVTIRDGAGPRDSTRISVTDRSSGRTRRGVAEG